MPASEADERDRVLRVLQSKSETKAFYDKISKVYDFLAERSEGPIRRSGLEKLAPAAGEHILEIGFGTGHTLVETARVVGPSGRVYGFDLSEGMREVAQERLREEQLADRVELRCGDAVALPYEPDSMDGVFMSFTLELFDNPEIPKVLSECLRVLKPAGRLVVVSLTKEGDQGIVSAFEWTHRHFPNFLDCRPIFVRRSIEAAGFRVRESLRMEMWVPVEIVLAEKP